MAMAAALVEGGTELYARNLKFIEEEIKIHDKVIDECRKLVLRCGVTVQVQWAVPSKDDNKGRLPNRHATVVARFR